MGNWRRGAGAELEVGRPQAPTRVPPMAYLCHLLLGLLRSKPELLLGVGKLLALAESR